MGNDNDPIIQYVSGMVNDISCEKGLYHKSNNK